MTDHTPEPWPKPWPGSGEPRWIESQGVWIYSQEAHDRARACVNACAGIPAEELTDLSFYTLSLDWKRVKACLDACAGIPTEQLGDVKALVNATAKAPQYIAVCAQEEADAGRSVTEKITRRHLQALTSALHPFLPKD